MARGKKLDSASHKLRAERFAAEVVKGNSLTQAAENIGIGPASKHSEGSRLGKDPVVIGEIKRLLESEQLGTQRVVKEIKRGLEVSGIRRGAHDVYLDKLMKLNGMTERQENPGTVVNVGKEAFEDFCRAYWETKAASGQ